jgi:hypothetical protein
MNIGPGILWTVMPIELVMGPGETGVAHQEVWQGERLFLVGGTGRIERLLSTNPYDYLNPAFQPGALLP